MYLTKRCHLLICCLKMWAYVYMCIFLVTASVVCKEQKESRLVQTVQGPVRGYKDPIEDIFVFYNIPYAKAPTGESKFKVGYFFILNTIVILMRLSSNN